MRELYNTVEIRLYPERLHGLGATRSTSVNDSQAFLSELVGRGLRARLGSANVLTGQRNIALEIFPKAPKVKINWKQQPPEFPTTRGGEDLQESLVRIARKIEKLPLEEIGEEVRQAAQNLDQSVRSADRLINRVDTEIVPEARAVMEEARKTLGDARGALSTDAPLQHDLRETLREISRAAWSVRILVDYLELYPESLIRGKKRDDK
jgi:paraquat-inducible protein B